VFLKIQLDNLLTVEQSNLFLRALWANIRSKFGKCAWSLGPHRDTDKKLITLGSMNYKDEMSLEVALHYKNKGNLIAISFITEDEQQALDLKIIKKLVKESLNYKTLMSDFCYTTKFESIRCNFSSYQGQYFKLNPLLGNFFECTIKICAFDNIDARTIILKKIKLISALLSVFSNCLILNTSKKVEASDIEIKENEYNINLDWIYDKPLKNNHILLSEKSCILIDKLISLDSFNEKINLILAAFTHFHSARAQDSFEHDVLMSAETSKVSDNVFELHFEKDDRFDVAKEIQMSSTEIASVLYMSSLEVASLIGEEVSKCNSCNQSKYSISSRVQNFVRENGGNDLVKTIRNYYNLRSRYLHQGMLLKNYSYSGNSIPTLDLESQSHIQVYSQVSVLNLREWCSYFLRQSVESMDFEKLG
jgi:hypothetical protein